MKKAPHLLTPEKAYAYATRRCSVREYAAKEMADKLLEQGYEEDLVAKVIAQLIRERYIDDARFAHAYTQDKYRFNRWGQYRIERELRLRGVASELITQAIAEIDWDIYLDNLKRTLEAKLRTLRPPIDYKQRQKLIATGIARGYHSDDIHHVLRQLLDDIEADEASEADTDLWADDTW